MSLALEEKHTTLKLSMRQPDFPRKPPMKNKSTFDDQKTHCSYPLCYNFALGCGLCDLHCRKIHNNRHSNLSSDDLEDLLKKYIDRKGK